MRVRVRKIIVRYSNRVESVSRTVRYGTRTPSHGRYSILKAYSYSFVYAGRVRDTYEGCAVIYKRRTWDIKRVDSIYNNTRRGRGMYRSDVVPRSAVTPRVRVTRTAAAAKSEYVRGEIVSLTTFS